MTTKHTIDQKLLDKFLGYVLDRYKADDIDLTTAVNRIAFLVAAVALPEGEGANPASYMHNVMAGEYDRPWPLR